MSRRNPRRRPKARKNNRAKTPNALVDLKKKVRRSSIDTGGNTLFGKSLHADDYEKFFEALKKPPMHRSNSDMALLKLLVSSVLALQSIPPGNFEGICRNIIHRGVGRKELVCKKGDAALEAYIVATGSIDVELDFGQGPVVVVSFNPGDFFGDYGLQKDDAKRTADCRARTDVGVIAVPRKTYIKFMMLHMHGNRDLKKEFFLKKLCLPIFATPPKFDAKDFTEQMDFMVCKSFKKGDLIGLQGHPSKKIHFVVQGTVRVLKTISIEGVPTVCEVGRYRKGQSFGARYTSISETNVHTWCADNDITLYVISRNEFQKLFGQTSVALYKSTTNIIDCCDRELRLGLKHQRKWAQYKRDLVEIVKCGGRTEWLAIPMRAEQYGYAEVLVTSSQRSNVNIEEFINE